MATLNKTNTAPRTHEGATACHINAEQQLRRSVLSCLLWEKEFYENGETIADRIKQGVHAVDIRIASALALEARSKYKLRHVPLLIAREILRHSGRNNEPGLPSRVIHGVVQRADELTEMLAIYWAEGKRPLSGQLKKGLALAFNKFDAYALAKYNRDKAIKLRDVLFLCHAKPKDEEQAKTWKALVDKELQSPDTWEVGLSAGKDKKDTWERLLRENKLGALALLRNLRNMKESKVSESLIFGGLAEMNISRVLPFRFIAAAHHAPQWESHIEKALFRCLIERPKLKGKTIVLVDVSGSMSQLLSDRSDMTRQDAACGVAICARELSDDVEIFSFSQNVVQIPARRGFALRDAIQQSQEHGCTYLGGAVNYIDANYEYNRLIVITDEQSHDVVPPPKGRGYMINVASAKNGVGYRNWIHIDGFSEAVLDYISEYEITDGVD